MKVQQSIDRNCFWEQPAPHRDRFRNTWLILPIPPGNVVAEMSLNDLADMLDVALDREAKDDLVDLLEARFPSADTLSGMSDCDLLRLIENARELVTLAVRVRAERAASGGGETLS